MCWYFCTSLRGSVYFGASVHIFVAFLFLMVLGFHGYVSIFVEDDILTNARLLIRTILMTIYGILFLIFGCLIFRGVEKRSLTLLKFSTVGITVLQLLFFIVKLVLYFVLPPEEFAPTYKSNEFVSEMWNNFLFIGLLCFGFLASVNYIIILILYVRKLWKSKTRQNQDQSNRNSNNTQLVSANEIGTVRTSPQLTLAEPIYSGSTSRARGASTFAGGSAAMSPSVTTPYYRNNHVSAYNEDPLTRQPFLSRESQVSNQSYPMYRYPQHFLSKTPSEQGDRDENIANWDQPRNPYNLQGQTHTTYRNSPISSSGVYSGPSSGTGSNQYPHDSFIRHSNHPI